MIKCPHCDVVMNEVRKAEINIDVCPKCMGVWLDKGELEKIMLRDREEDAYSRTDRYDHRENSYKHHDDDHHERDHDNEKYYDKNGYPRKRRGGLGEIFGNLFD